MKQRITIRVKNRSNDHVHFERVRELPDGVSVPMEQILSSLLWLYSGLDVFIQVDYGAYNEKLFG